jgi:hypothetical protein
LTVLLDFPGGKPNGFAGAVMCNFGFFGIDYSLGRRTGNFFNQAGRDLLGAGKITPPL